MALSARIPSTATTATYFWVPAIYTNKVIEATKSNLVAVDATNFEWLSGQPKGAVFYMPKTNVVTAIEIVVNAKGAATNPLNTAGITVTMDQWYQAPVDVDVMTKFQSQAALEKFATTEAAYAINVAVDSYVCALFDDLGGYSTTAYGTDGQTLDDNLLILASQTLNEANVPTTDRSLIIDPSGLADMMKFDKFISSQYVAVGAVSSGIIGTSPIYGCKVRMSNNLTVSAGTVGNVGVMLHKDAIAGKIQMDESWMWEYKDLHTTRYQSEVLWGASVAQVYHGFPFYTRKA
jgi:hypothetical protein